MTFENITFDKVKSLYPHHTIVGVKEAWKEGIGWFSHYNDQPLNDPDKSAIEQISFCHSIGATSVNLILKSNLISDHHTYPDYKMTDLIKN